MTDLLTTNEVQELLQVDRTTIYRLVESGRLPAIRIGKQWRFSRPEIERWLRAQAAAAPVPSSPPPAAQPEGLVAARTPADLPLRDLLPTDCVQAIQDAFADVLGVMIVITEMDGQPVTQASNPCGLYAAAIRDAGGLATCVAHWQQMAGLVSLEPRFMPSDLGLLCARGLIRVGDTLKGMVFFGGVAPDPWPPSEAELAAIAGRFGLEISTAQANIEAVHRLDKMAQGKVLRFVQRVADIISHIAEERSQVQSRLQVIAALTSLY